ncbi:hypothetical protein ABWJ92_37580 [Streptomyces sp. NPDC000609]|uniref:hypothetical protein n=1 Tax=Streptomyces sp. NPDC000609 TaxID=3160957 RepID=UPI0033910EC1
MLKGMNSRAVALAALGVVLAGTTAGVAYAVADNVKAPYAQAAATVQSNGTISNAKGIESVKRINTGEYCINFADADLKVSKSILQATANSANRILQVTWGSGIGCGSAQNTAKVNVSNENGTKADSWFTISVH